MQISVINANMMERNKLKKAEIKKKVEETVDTDMYKKSSPSEPLSDYERYCQQQADAFMDEIGDDRCFGDMAEGVFVRGH